MRLCLLTALAIPAMMAVADAQQIMPRGPVLSVRGVGTIEVPPDHAKLSVDVVTKADNLAAAAKAHESRATNAASILRDLVKDGLEIERSSYRLGQLNRQVQVPTGQQPPRPEFQAVTSFILKSSRIGNLNEAISTLAAKGLFEVRNVSFAVDDQRGALNMARKKAVDDAREQARAYADAAGVSLEGILEITDGEAHAGGEGQADLPSMRRAQIIPPATVSFNASVTIKWGISPQQK
jgi:uncharacterized protein